MDLRTAFARPSATLFAMNSLLYTSSAEAGPSVWITGAVVFLGTVTLLSVALWGLFELFGRAMLEGDRQKPLRVIGSVMRTNEWLTLPEIRGLVRLQVVLCKDHMRSKVRWCRKTKWRLLIYMYNECCLQLSSTCTRIDRPFRIEAGVTP